MSILIVAATEAEIAPFRQRNPRQTCLITGVGSAITAYHLTEALLSHKYNAAIQVGIAGALNDAHALGEVVHVVEDQFTDLGSWEQGTFQTLHQLNLSNDQAFPFTNGRIANDSSLVDLINLPKVIGSTVNILTDDIGLLDACHRRVHADVESMEGAAFHYVCRKQHISFLQIRGISNRVGDRQKNNWKLAEAINNSSMVLEQLVHTLNTRSWN
ncbi:MAG: futalosine hydrolase [Ferruginibacter sp.]